MKTFIIAAIAFFVATGTVSAQEAADRYSYSLHTIREKLADPKPNLQSSMFAGEKAKQKCDEHRTSVLKLKEGETLTSEEQAATACVKSTQDVNQTIGGKSYTLLSGSLPGISVVDETTTFPQYLQIIFKLLIGLTTIAAVVSLIIAGMQYMTTDAFSQKETAIGRIKAIGAGILLAMSAWIILNTIDPNLLKLEFIGNDDIVRTTVTGDVFVPDENYVTDSTSYRLSGVPTTGVSDLAAAFTRGEDSLAEIRISGASATFISTKGTEVAVPIGTGKNGFAAEGQGKTDDGKTPRGTFITGTIGSSLPRAVVSSDITQPIMTINDPKVNLGAAFIGISAEDGGTNRGIGFHGFRSGEIGPTNGCISMRNYDLSLLAPHMGGVTVVIE